MALRSTRATILRPPRPEAQSGQLEPLAADVELRPRVFQHLDAAPRQRRRHVAVVVVVAEDGKDAMRRVQRRQQFGDRLDERAIAERHVVAAEHDQIGLLRRAAGSPRASRRPPAPCAL